MDVQLGVQIQVVLPQGGERLFPASDLAGIDLATASDRELIDAAIKWMDQDPASFPNLTVTRPRTGNVVISPKAEFGATREEDLAVKAKIASDLARLLNQMKSGKPNDRTEEDRAWAIAITDLERVMAWWEYWVMG